MKKMLFLFVPFLMVLFFVKKYGPTLSEVNEKKHLHQTPIPLEPFKIPLPKTIIEEKRISQKAIKISTSFTKTKNLRKRLNVKTLWTLPEGLIVAKDLRALKKDNFLEGDGEAVHAEKGIVFFRPMKGREDEEWVNVAYDPQNNAFYPISAVLKVEDVNEKVRKEIFNLGHREFHYLEHLRLLYVQSTHIDLFPNYQKLLKMGLKVHLEVLKDFHDKK